MGRPMWALASDHGDATFRLSRRLREGSRGRGAALAWMDLAYAAMRALNRWHQKRPPRRDCCMACHRRFLAIYKAEGGA
jgi:hypothetical protein